MQTKAFSSRRKRERLRCCLSSRTPGDGRTGDDERTTAGRIILAVLGCKPGTESRQPDEHELYSEALAPRDCDRLVRPSTPSAIGLRGCVGSEICQDREFALDIPGYDCRGMRTGGIHHILPFLMHQEISARAGIPSRCGAGIIGSIFVVVRRLPVAKDRSPFRSSTSIRPRLDRISI